MFGAPQGDAIICWFSGGRVGIEGKLFADSLSGEPLVATAEIRYTRADGQVTVRRFGIGTNISWVASGLVRDLVAARKLQQPSRTPVYVFAS
jgi:hypothetical protein